MTTSYLSRWMLLGACLGCASEWTPVGSMLHEGRNNDLAATQKYQAQLLALTGVVVATGKKKIEHGSARTDGRWVEAPASDADVERPFVQIGDANHPSPDYVTCYLDRTATLPPLARGATANVRGFFLEYAAAAGHVEAVLDRCSVEIPK